MNIFKEDGNYIYLNVPYCEFYIPMYYFDDGKRFAEDYINHMSVLGVFNVGIFEGGKLKELKTFNMPTFIDIRIYQSEIRDVKLKDGIVTKCKVCKYYKDNIITNLSLIEDSDNVQIYLDMIIGGSLPNTIPYSNALQSWSKNLEINNIGLGVSSTILELILSVVYRDKNNLESKFSKVYGKDKSVSDFDYATASIRQICQYASTFTAITYEDMDTMITTSINRQREGKEEAETPLEKLIKM